MGRKKKYNTEEEKKAANNADWKRLTPEQLKEYENQPLTEEDIIEMEKRGFKIPEALKLTCKFQMGRDNISLKDELLFQFFLENKYKENFEELVKDMLKFSISSLMICLSSLFFIIYNLDLSNSKA